MEIEAINPYMERHLFETILRGDTQAFLSLIQQDEAKIKQTVPGSLNTILHLTARFGHEELASEILKLCPEMVAAENEKMETPLHEACREGRLNFVKLFVGIDPSVIYKLNRDNESVLYVACERGRLDVAKQLLNYSSLLILEVDGLTTSLHVSAMAGHLGNFNIRYLLKLGKMVMVASANFENLCYLYLAVPHTKVDRLITSH